MNQTFPAGVQILAPKIARCDEILTAEAMSFVAKLRRTFEGRLACFMPGSIDRP